jgi:hypothetical protein
MKMNGVCRECGLSREATYCLGSALEEKMRSWSHREFEIIEAENVARASGSSGLYPVVVAVWGIVTFVVVVDSLDTASLQIVGYVLYPLEYVINAALFPHAVTQLHGNATALLILIPTLAMFFVGVAAIRHVAEGGRRALQFLRRTR